MRKLILYSTSACHLCEFAKAIVKPFVDNGDLSLNEIDIANSDALIEKYGIKIPVVAIEGSVDELHWPFDSDMFRDFIKSSSD